jgi:hypothetical protein
MPRIVQDKAAKGSQHWLQELANRKPQLLVDRLRPLIQLGASDTITWFSPKEDDDYAEYQDQEPLDMMSVSLKHKDLDTFWPQRGPVWDGLGKSSRGDIILVEAKAHTKEADSPCQASSPQSLALIKRSLADTAEYFGAASAENWLQEDYQYANRLAHLYFLWQLNKISTWLVFMYFVNDAEMGGPKTEREWRPIIDDTHMRLGLRRDRLAPHVVEAYFDVTTI